MKMIQTTITVMFFGIILINPLFAYAQTQGWDEKISEQERVQWENFIEAQEHKINEWGKNRDRALRKMTDRGGQNISERAKEPFCLEQMCWKESILDFTVTDRSTGETFEIDRHRDFIDGTWRMTFFNNANGGQSIEVKFANGRHFDSGNYGQSIEYKNDRYFWDSTNFGQGIEYTNPNGERWKFSNYGHRVTQYDASGKEIFSGAEDDSIDNL